MQNLDAIIRVCMVLCETWMLLFVSVWCDAKPRCYYSSLYGVMRNLDAIIRVCMVLCKTLMLLFVSRIMFVLRLNLIEILGSLKRDWKGEKNLWNTTRQLPDPTMAPQVFGQLLVCIYQFLTSNSNFKTKPNLQNFLFP